MDLPLTILRNVSIVNMISPKWEVLDRVTIDVSGSKGESQTESNFFRPARCKAANGSRPGAKGADGKPGGPGEPGAIFFGIVGKFVNGESLTIKANGGEGGAAEHGGDGYVGRDGYDAVMPSGRITCDINCVGVSGFDCKRIDFWTEGGNCVGFGAGIVCFPIKHHCRYKIFGSSGEIGGDGGNGGRGGKGGAPGRISLIQLEGDSVIEKINSKGKDGENGDGGKGGYSGKDGDDIIVYNFVSNAEKRRDLRERIEKTRVSSGRHGVEGRNTVGLLDPKPPNILKDPAKIVNKYKSYLRENILNRFTRSRRIEFFKKLDTHEDIQSMYDILGFIDEFEGLERQLHNLNSDVDFMFFYNSLLSRISEYAKSPKESEKVIQHKKVLNFLYTATLGKIRILKEDSESNLIVNIGDYLDIVKKEIETLKDLQKTNNKVEIIGKHQERYKNNLDSKIEEAKNIISRQLTPEMENVSKEMNEKIDLLIEETIELQKKAQVEKEILANKKKELENAMALRGIFSCFSIFSQVVSFFGPLGAAVGSVIGTTSSVAESLALDRQQTSFQIPPSVVSNLRALEKQIKNVRIQKLVYFEELLEQISKEIIKIPGRLGDMAEKIVDMKSRLSRAKDNTDSFKVIRTLESELKQELKLKERELKGKGVIPDGKTKGALKVLQKFTEAVQLGSLLVEVYNKHKSDQEKVDAITEAIKNAEDKILKLKTYEEQIYEIMIPMLKSMEATLHNVVNKLEAKSQVSLDLAKWKVQSSLRDMKLQMQQMTEGFQVKDNLARCIEKLEEIMITLINVYDRIQTYQEQENLANYIADISSSSASSINISNPTLVKAVNRLEMLIRSNVVLAEYKTALNAFKQWVFPFGSYYLDDYMLPAHLELEDNIANLVDNAIKQIQKIKSKLDKYKTSLKKTDKYIHTGEFNSRYMSTKPFYVWRNYEYKDTISKFLSGQEIVIKADVKKSANDKDAIKFSVVEFHFKSNNETMQSQLNYVIKGFDIKATHLGNSYYRYADNIYVTTSDSQTLSYSYEKNMVGEPVRKNNVFDKIKEGDLMLSPYTLWGIKLINATDNISFRDLEIYKDYVDLELSGYGSYVVRNANDIHFEDKEYGYVGKYNEVNVAMESFVKNYSENKDLVRMIRSPHQEEAFKGYVTNGAVTSLSSPLNYICKILETIIASSVTGFLIGPTFNSKVNDLNFKKNRDASVKGFTNFESDIAKTEKSMDCCLCLTTSESKINRCSVNVRCKCENDLRISSFLNYTDGKSYSFSQPLDINCTLLFADLVTRTVTGNKYKQAIDECLLSPRKKLELKFDEFLIKSENDVKRHLCTLSRMTGDIKIPWYSKVKSFGRSMLQYFGFDSNSDSDDILEAVRILFSNKQE